MELLVVKTPEVAVIALGGTRRPGRDGFSWPPLRSSGTDVPQLDRELGVCPRTGPPPGNAGASGLDL
ncbi:MAG TPA: hypothetical protein VK780_08810 [Thermoanaerobaculia bacterium]|jgi:hypothetical protein|nr:hypothetical protein [Thermoanaerobaculia bacterium]